MNRIATLAALALGLGLSTAAAADTPMKVRWGVSVNQSLSHAIAPMLELDEEIQARHGIDFETIDFAGNFQACMALAISGEIDGCQTGPTIGMNAIAQGADLKGVIQMIGQITEITLSTKAIEASGVALDAPLEDRIRALKGLTIAGAGPGTSPYMIVENLMARVGLTIDDLTYQPLTDVPALNANLMSGRVDATIWSLGGLSPAQAAGAGQVWISLARGDVPELGALPNVATFARTAWVAENMDLLRRTQAAFVDVLAALRADPIGYSAAWKAKYNEAIPMDRFERDLMATLPVYITDMEGTCEAWDFWVDRLNVSAEADAERARCAVAYVKLRQ
jgi:ABC-type nitrate/sulfonate/bicarbonate transport system substrate-binding protein